MQADRAAEALRQVVRFLDANEGGAVCQMCVGSLFEVGADDVRKLVGALRRTPGVRIETSPCSLCRKVRPAIRLTPRRAEPGSRGEPAREI